MFLFSTFITHWLKYLISFFYIHPTVDINYPYSISWFVNFEFLTTYFNGYANSRNTYVNFQQLNVNVETKGFLSMFFNDRRYKYVENAHVCCSGTVIVNRTVANVGPGKSVYFFAARPPMGFSIKASPSVLSFDHVGQKRSFIISNHC